MDDGLPTRIISDGRLTVPEEFREKYALEQGDRVWVKVEPIDDDSAVDPLGW